MLKPCSQRTLAAAVKRDFGKFDLDDNGRVSVKELEQSLLDDRFEGESAVCLSTLYRYRSAAGHRGFAPEDLRKLGQDADKTFQEKLDKSEHLKDELFPRGQGQAIQGHVSDCWFVAGLHSLENSRPGELRQRIKDQGGSFEVSFPDGTKTNVSAPTEAERLSFASDSEGYLWAGVLEKAYGQKHQGFLKEQLAQNSLTVFGTAARGIKALTGHSVDTDHTLVTRDETTRRKLQQALSTGGVVVASSKQNIGRRLLGRSPDKDGIIAGHCYSVVRFDPQTDLVTLRNPWGDEGWKLANKQSKDGEFDMPLSKLGTYFSSLSYEQIESAEGLVRPG